MGPDPSGKGRTSRWIQWRVESSEMDDGWSTADQFKSSPVGSPMRLEYLASGSPDCPLIRLYDFQPSEAAELLAAINALASGAAQRVEVDRLSCVEATGGCRLVFTRQHRDRAIVSGASHHEFECGFTAATWNNVAGLVEPFAEGGGGFQWLAGAPGDAALLISASPGGEW